MNFKHNLLYSLLNKKYDKPSSAAEFKDSFMQCIESDTQKSRYFIEWREKLNKEMQIFNGKIVVDRNEGETASTMSGATGMTGA